MRQNLCLTSALLIGQLTACTSWRVPNVPPQQFTPQSAAQLVHVVRRNGTAVTLQAVRVSGDTLYGTPAVGRGPVLAIALGDVQTIEVRQPSSAKTIGLVAGITVAVAGAIVLWFVVTCALCLG